MVCLSLPSQNRNIKVLHFMTAQRSYSVLWWEYWFALSMTTRITIKVARSRSQPRNILVIGCSKYPDSLSFRSNEFCSIIKWVGQEQCSKTLISPSLLWGRFLCITTRLTVLSFPVAVVFHLEWYLLFGRFRLEKVDLYWLITMAMLLGTESKKCKIGFSRSYSSPYFNSTAI